MKLPLTLPSTSSVPVMFTWVIFRQILRTVIRPRSVTVIAPSREISRNHGWGLNKRTNARSSTLSSLFATCRTSTAARRRASTLMTVLSKCISGCVQKKDNCQGMTYPDTGDSGPNETSRIIAVTLAFPTETKSRSASAHAWRMRETYRAAQWKPC